MRALCVMAAILLAGCSQRDGLREVRQAFPGAAVAPLPDVDYRFIVISSGKVYYVVSDGFSNSATPLGPDSTYVVQLFDDAVAVER